MVTRPVGSSPHVGKPRGGGVAEGSRVWLRSRLHADEPRGGHLSEVDESSFADRGDEVGHAAEQIVALGQMIELHP